MLLLVQVNNTNVTVFLGSRCSQIILCVIFVESSDMAADPIYLQCIHGDVLPYPAIKEQLEVGGHTETCWVVLVATLAYPVILGQHWRWFGKPQWQWNNGPLIKTYPDPKMRGLWTRIRQKALGRPPQANQEC